MAINHPDPEGEVWFIAIKPKALYYNCYIFHVIGH